MTEPTGDRFEFHKFVLGASVVGLFFVWWLLPQLGGSRRVPNFMYAVFNREGKVSVDEYSDEDYGSDGYVGRVWVLQVDDRTGLPFPVRHSLRAVCHAGSMMWDGGAKPEPADLDVALAEWHVAHPDGGLQGMVPSSTQPLAPPGGLASAPVVRWDIPGMIASAMFWVVVVGWPVMFVRSSILVWKDTTHKRRQRLRERAIAQNLCPYCAYNLSGIAPPATTCPQCGRNRA